VIRSSSKRFFIPPFVSAVFVACSAVSAGVVVSHPFLGITQYVDTETSPRNVTMNVVQVDLTAPGISFEMSPGASGTPSRETVRQTTVNYLNQVKAQVAINGMFFSPFPSNDSTAYVAGLAASNGTIFSNYDPEPTPVNAGDTITNPDQSYAIVPYGPALNISAANVVSILHYDPSNADKQHNVEGITPYNAISGSSQIVTDGAVSVPVYGNGPNAIAGGLLNSNATYSNNHSWYGLTNARTAIGISQDGKMLTLFTVDATAGSLGLTGTEEANILINTYGVYEALNLDGGGSTALAMQDSGTGIGYLVNNSSDSAATIHTGRSEATNFAVFAAPIPEPTSLGALAVGGLLLLRPHKGRTKRAGERGG
jgi:exopolysaccharide biosynthesis protein